MNRAIRAVKALMCGLIIALVPGWATALPGFVLSRISLRVRGGGASLRINFSGGLAPYAVVNRSATSYAVVFPQTMIPASGVHVPRARTVNKARACS